MEKQIIIDMKKVKEYVIESKGFKNGIGSKAYSDRRNKRLEDIKRQLAELENNKNY